MSSVIQVSVVTDLKEQEAVGSFEEKRSACGTLIFVVVVQVVPALDVNYSIVCTPESAYA